jgi:hypothetical protein
MGILETNISGIQRVRKFLDIHFFFRNTGLKVKHGQKEKGKEGGRREGREEGRKDGRKERGKEEGRK